MSRGVRLLALVMSSVVWSSAAAAGEGTPCEVPDHLVDAEFPTQHVAAAIAKKQLKIVVLGTSSSVVGNANAGFKAYPVRLEEDLAARLPGVEVKVRSLAKPRQMAAEIEKSFARIIAEETPSLVVWQTGTIDAMRGVGLEDFRIALSDGVEALQEAKIDVVLMNMQYSPRTDLMIALGSYLDSMRLVALQHEVALFDRFSVMKYWNEHGVFDLYTTTKKTDVADNVHQCIGRLLGNMIVNGATWAAANTGQDAN